MAKYDGLVRLLNAEDDGAGQLELTFARVSDAVDGGLPPSAFSHEAWWANDSVGHVQSKAWLGAGWRVAWVDVPQRVVGFEREPVQAERKPEAGLVGSQNTEGGEEEPMASGHVFVVRGRLENLDADAVLVPTSLEFGVRRIWASALGVPERQPSRDFWEARAREAQPVDWSTNDGWGRATEHALPYARPTWFVDSTRRGGLRGMGRRLTQTLEDIARAGLATHHDRPRPLVALPVLGVGHGGFGGKDRGAALRAQLEICLYAVSRFELDIVIVAFQPSDYSALQAYRRDNGLYVELPIDQRKELAALASKVRQGTLAVFFGAGVSMSAGLPSWPELLKRLDESAEPAAQGFDGLKSPLDQAQLLRKRLADNLGPAVAEVTGGKPRYGLSHALLAALDCPHVVTTNYDQLYERAYEDGHRRGPQLRVLPYGAPEPGSPWLVKMHGDVDHPSDIVLARSDFVGYSARSGPLGAVVQSLLMTEHLLVVGASLSDDNFLRLAHEVLDFRSHHLGTVLKFTVTDAERELWRGEFQFVEVSHAGCRDGESARKLAVFLDRLAMEAAPPHHLLDRRYAELLAAPERQISEDLRAVAGALSAMPPAERGRWIGISAVLEQYGAGGVPKEVPRFPRGEEEAVIVRSMWERSGRWPAQRVLLVEVPLGQVTQNWPRRRVTNEPWKIFVDRYLREVAEVAERWPGSVAPGHVTCAVTREGKVLESFVDPRLPYSPAPDADGAHVRLGLVVPDVASIADIPEETMATALRLGISTEDGASPSAWDGTELAAAGFMNEARQRGKGREEFATRLCESIGE